VECFKPCQLQAGQLASSATSASAAHWRVMLGHFASGSSRFACFEGFSGLHGCAVHLEAFRNCPAVQGGHSAPVDHSRRRSQLQSETVSSTAIKQMNTWYPPLLMGWCVTARSLVTPSHFPASCPLSIAQSSEVHLRSYAVQECLFTVNADNFGETLQASASTTSQLDLHTSIGH
jgi:hypothetical protein